MNEILVAASIFCSHLNSTEAKKICVFDILWCQAKVEREWEYIYEKFQEHDIFMRENSHRLMSMATCLLAEMPEEPKTSKNEAGESTR